jgi:AraC-like DNA-binding protein
MVSDDVMALRISSDAFSGHDRIDAFLEIFGRTILKIDIDPLEGHALNVDMTLRALSGVGIASGLLSPMRNSVRSQCIDNDDPVLVTVQSGCGEIRQAGREATVRDGEAVLTASENPGIFTGHTATQVTNFRLGRARLAAMVPSLDDALLRPIPQTSGALRLLTAYAEVLGDAEALATPELRSAVVSHIHDLAALALGASRDAAALALGGGVRAARLREIKNDIITNIANPRLSVDAVALRHGISSSYIRQLFAAEATTFTDFVLGQRLARAHRMLTDLRFAGWMISMIAFECGFGDLSYFNRTFRRLYGATPSDLREVARKG